jgi:propanol-preferring alcohol dehydrogenase
VLVRRVVYCWIKICPNYSISGPEDVLIKLNATGLCMSDVHFMLNDWASPPMSNFGTQCAGHEGAGVIVKIGDRVKHLEVGQRAGYKPIQDVCHTCPECKNGRETYCLQAVLTGLHIDGKATAKYTLATE